MSGLIVALTTGALTIQPHASTADAENFLTDYYNRVTRADQRESVFDNELSSSFKAHQSLAGYDTFWQKERTVLVGSVEPVTGNPMEFDARLTYIAVNGDRSRPERTRFTFVCDGSWTTTRLALLLGCPPQSLRVSSTVSITDPVG
jgi:hypothetical protein